MFAKSPIHLKTSLLSHNTQISQSATFSKQSEIPNQRRKATIRDLIRMEVMRLKSKLGKTINEFRKTHLTSKDERKRKPQSMRRYANLFGDEGPRFKRELEFLLAAEEETRTAF